MHRRSFAQARLLISLIVFAVASTMLAATARAQSEGTLRHTVVKGDTLWDLSARYLENPWLWPDLWEQNSEIENPHLIFPGDVLLIDPNSIRLIPNKRLTVNKLSPQIRREPTHAITTIDPSIIMPYLNQSIIVEPEILESAAYVLQGIDDKIILGKDSRFFARGLEDSTATEFLVFKPGRVIQNRFTDKDYGVEGVHLGLARLVRHEGEITELELVKANQDVRPGDRLLPIDEPTEIPRYFPRRPNVELDTRIISIPKGIDEAGLRDVVIISGGANQGLENGHVLEVFSYRGEIKDPVTGELVALPDNQVAIAMVFKAYRDLSYAILMETYGPVKVGDRASTP